MFEDPYEAKMKALKAKSGSDRHSGDRHSGDRHSGDRHSGDISSPAASPFGATLKKTPGGIFILSVSVCVYIYTYMYKVTLLPPGVFLIYMLIYIYILHMLTYISHSF